ncbi:glycosyltransferase [Pseudotenacibaculum sp. MALMAid0570]|uniref:glycosyltransferase n=1 Tax=Pseudotenacibaculum sp. MALMAid0570 TaxID=3143938 RepID=UPI0032DEEBEB
MKRIVVSVSNDLVTDQRVAKICRTLHELDYEILLIGRKNYSPFVVNRDYKTKRMRMLFNKGFLFYAELNIRLFFLLFFTKKDILFSNDLDTLLPNYLVSKIQGKELIFDSHELFSEIPELTNRKFVKSVWHRLEKWMLPKLKKVITVSDSIKKHYQDLYKIQVTVVRNLPDLQEINQNPFPFSIKGKTVIVYQGAINVGRGLELMIGTMKLLENHLLVIIGTGDIIDVLEAKVLNEKLENSVKFMGKILPEDLKRLTSNADIGISLEEDLGLNYRYALPNKVFDYIHAEIPVIASDLPEMKKLIQKYQVGEIIKERTSEELAKLIEEVAQKDYTKALSVAKQELNWSREKVKLIKLLQS